MPDGLYERDALAWAEQQTALLRRLANGERVNDAVDWPNVIEEVRDVGLSELRACQSLLTRALAHLLKLHGWPESPSAAHWRGEIAAFLGAARRSFTPSMRRRIDLEELYADALYEVRAAEGGPDQTPALPAACPFALDDLLEGRPDPAALLAKLSRAAQDQ